MALSRERRQAREILIYHANSVVGICEKLRFIYDEVHGMKGNEQITQLLIDAMIMAKKMQNRLTYYKVTYNDITGHNGVNLEKSLDTVKRDSMRRARKNE